MLRCSLWDNKYPDFLRSRSFSSSRMEKVSGAKPVVMAAEPIPAQATRAPVRLNATSIRVIAQGLPGLSQSGANLREDVSNALVAEAEGVVRELASRAMSFMRHSHRENMTSCDMAAALRLRGRSAITHGYIARDVSERPFHFARVPGASDLFVTADTKVALKDVNHAPLPLDCHLEEVVHPMWLLFNGVANPRAVDGAKRPRSGEQGLDAYYARIRTLILSLSEGNPRAVEVDTMLASLSRVRAVHALTPAMLSLFYAIVAENVREAGCTAKLIAATRALRAIVNNSQFGFDAYVHNALPPLLTCMGGRSLGSGDHIELRRLAADVLHDIFASSGTPLAKARATKTLLAVLMSDQSELPALYGAVVGLCALGPQVLKVALLPHVPALLLSLSRIAEAIDDLEEDAEEMRSLSAAAYASQCEYVLKVKTDLRNVSSAVASACEMSAVDFDVSTCGLAQRVIL
jgi:transcription initiation factor TFIID subunit 6